MSAHQEENDRPRSAADRIEIEALRGEFSDAVLVRDYDRLAALFTEDGVIRIPEAGSVASSRAEIRAGASITTGTGGLRTAGSSPNASTKSGTPTSLRWPGTRLLVLPESPSRSPAEINDHEFIVHHSLMAYDSRPERSPESEDPKPTTEPDIFLREAQEASIESGNGINTGSSETSDATEDLSGILAPRPAATDNRSGQQRASDSLASTGEQLMFLGGLGRRHGADEQGPAVAELDLAGLAAEARERLNEAPTPNDRETTDTRQLGRKTLEFLLQVANPGVCEAAVDLAGQLISDPESFGQLQELANLRNHTDQAPGSAQSPDDKNLLAGRSLLIACVILVAAGAVTPIFAPVVAEVVLTNEIASLALIVALATLIDGN